jgi:hypothetical protein
MENELRDRIAKHGFLSTIPPEQIEGAILTLEKYISNQYQYVENYVSILVRESDKHSHNMSVLDDLLPGLIFAHRYFGKELPATLIQKIINKRQLTDTIFELRCMGMFLDKHKISYEPRLDSGKVPEFKISLDGAVDTYVECKSQNQWDSEHLKKYNRVVNKIMNKLNESVFIKNSWGNGYRTEVYPTRYIHDSEIDELIQKLDGFSFSDLVDLGKNITKNILIICVPREQEPKFDKGLRVSSVTVGTTPTKVSHENAHLIINAWEGVNIQARRSKRKLLGEARKKLKGIPKGALGLICIQAYGAMKFLPDIQKLMLQKEYVSIPIVWLNPFNENQVICRNEFLELRNNLFKGMIAY